jgi:hypothetical protein
MALLNVKLEGQRRYHLSVLVLKISHRRNLRSIYLVNCDALVPLTHSLSLFRDEPVLSEQVENRMMKPEQSRDHDGHLKSVRVRRVTHQALSNCLRQLCPWHFR